MKVEEDIGRYADWLAERMAVTAGSNNRQPDAYTTVVSKRPPARRPLLVGAGLVVLVGAIGIASAVIRDDRGPTNVVTGSATNSEALSSTTTPSSSTSMLGESGTVSGNSAAQVWTGSELFVIGGANGGVDSAMGSRFDPKLGQWTPMAPAPHPRRAGIAIWTGREVWVMGGSQVGVDAYQPWSDSWRTLVDPPVSLIVAPGQVFDGVAAFEDNGKLAVWLPSAHRVAVYDDTLKSWRLFAVLDPDVKVAKLVWGDGRVFAVLARGSAQSTLSVLEFDTSSDRDAPTVAPKLSFNDNGFDGDAWPDATLWDGTNLMAWTARAPQQLAYILTAEGWVPVAGPILASCDSAPIVASRGSRTLVATDCSPDVSIYDRATSKWTVVPALSLPDGKWPANRTVAWNGTQLLAWQDSGALWIMSDDRLG